MTYLQTYILGRSLSKKKQFKRLLEQFWNPYNVDVWKVNACFNSFVGGKIKLFIDNIPLIIKVMKKEFASTGQILGIVKGLNIWHNIVPFLGITTIGTETNKYRKLLTQFENDVKDFYEIGGKTFLTKRSIVGDDETFYMHCLGFYFPMNAKDKFEDHNLSLGIFTMQDYEHQNKQSKRIWSRFNDHTNLVTSQNLKRFYDNFCHK